MLQISAAPSPNTVGVGTGLVAAELAGGSVVVHAAVYSCWSVGGCGRIYYKQRGVCSGRSSGVTYYDAVVGGVGSK